MLCACREFGDTQLEHAYRAVQHRAGATRLLVVLYVLILGLLFVALNHLFRPDVVLLWATTSATFALGLIIRLNVLSSTIKHNTLGDESSAVFTISTLWILASCASLAALATQSATALVPTVIGVFTLYIAPIAQRLASAAACAFSLSIIHLTAFIFYANEQRNGNATRQIIEHLIAHLIVHVWANFIGFYIFAVRNRLSRAAFLNARNALASQSDAIQQYTRMSSLLRAALPSHVIACVQKQLDANVPRIYVEHYACANVIYARLYGMQSILHQLSEQDSARLINEFHYRIDQLVNRYNFIRIRSDAIVVVAGILPTEENGDVQRTIQSCYFARDFVLLIRSFCDSTTANVGLRVGISSGALSCGIIGAQKWHYDIIGEAFDKAKQLEAQAQMGEIFVDKDINIGISHHFVTQYVNEDSISVWRVAGFRNSPCCSGDYDSGTTPFFQRGSAPPSLLFASGQKRFSLVTIPQAISRLLQSSAVASVASAASKFSTASAADTKFDRRRSFGRNGSYKRKSTDGSRSSPRQERDQARLLAKQESSKRKNSTVLDPVSQRFSDSRLEQEFAAQIDRWLVPALAISVLFLLVNAVYQIFTLPYLLSILIIAVTGLIILFAVLLLLYIKYFESFCHFVTRTSIGYSIALLLIIVVLFLCGMINLFSCDEMSDACGEVHYAAASVALWMLTTVIFIRFGHFYLFWVMVAAIFVYCIQVFGTHYNLYLLYSLRIGWHVEYDIIISLITLAGLVLLQARRNEQMLRMDFLSVLKTFEETHRLERLEAFNEQIVFSALPTHIAHNFLVHNEPYHHLCSNVGVLCAQLGNASDWHGEFGFDRLNRLVFTLDQTLDAFAGVEKVRSAHCVYTCAVGILLKSTPVGAKNASESHQTVSDLLGTLTNFAIKLKQIVNKEDLQIAIGIDCGSALSLVLGQEKPQYELIGSPCERAYQLMNFAGELRVNSIIVSEEVFLALRPQLTNGMFGFNEDEKLNVTNHLIGYELFEESLQNHFKMESSEELKNGVQKESSITKIGSEMIPLPSQIVLRNSNMNTSHIVPLQHPQKYNSFACCPLENSQKINRKNASKRYSYQANMANNFQCNQYSPPVTTTTIRTDGAHAIHHYARPTTVFPVSSSTKCISLTAAVKEMRQTPYQTSTSDGVQSPLSIALMEDCTTESVLSASISETDFDEIDERVAEAACARENSTTGRVSRTAQKRCSHLTTLQNDQMELPSDLLALKRDKRMSGYLLSNNSNEHLHDSSYMNKGKENGHIGNSKSIAERNPFEMFASLNSSFSSEIFSVDMSIESDSEIEWITPDMLDNNNRENAKNNNVSHKNVNNDKFDQFCNLKIGKNYHRSSSRQLFARISASSSKRTLDQSFDGVSIHHRRQLSDQFSGQSGREAGWETLSWRMRRKKFRFSRNGPRLPDWLASSSHTSLSSHFSASRSRHASYSALDRLDAAARRVDKMLQELASVDGAYALLDSQQRATDCARFPLTSSVGASTSALADYGMSPGRARVLRRELSSACHTEYDNAESDMDAFSDPEMVAIYNNSRPENDGHLHDSISQNTMPNDRNNKCDENMTLAQKIRRAFLGFSEENLSDLRPNHYRNNALPPFPPNTVATNHMKRVHPKDYGGKRKNQPKHLGPGAYEADVDSNCSSLASSLTFLNNSAKNGGAKISQQNDFENSGIRRMNSVHSVGYDNEYELVSESDYCGDSDLLVYPPARNNEAVDGRGAFDPTRSACYDAFPAADEDEPLNDAPNVSRISSDYGSRVRALTRDIRRTFGDCKLADLSDT